MPVKKSSGDVRICGDYKLTVNQAAKGDSNPLPHIDELYAKLSGGTVSSKLDLSNDYQQLQLDPDSQMLTTVNTPKGTYGVYQATL